MDNSLTNICRCQINLVNKRGLHARASAKFVKVASEFSAKIKVTKDGLKVGGTSIMGLMLLAAPQGSTLEIDARGEDAEQAIEALKALISDRFGEEC